MFQALVKPTTILSAFARRNLSVASVLRTDGATASSREFGEKERAAEKQWARKHDAELLEKLKKSLAEQEKATNEIKEKLNELENKK